VDISAETLEKYKGQNNKNEKWNAQQIGHFVRYRDIYQGEPYKSYWNVDIGPPLAIAQPQQQVAQQTNRPTSTTLSPNRPTIHSATAFSPTGSTSSRSRSTTASTATHHRYAAAAAVYTN
jgi:hypothetical protein